MTEAARADSLAPEPRGRLEMAAIALCAAGVAVAVFHHLFTPVLPWDDAYITFRYADRLATGAGLTYNDGERVFGSSTPLYALWLAAARTVLPREALPAFAVRGNLAFFLLAAAAVGAVTASITRRRDAGWAGASAFLLSPWMLTISTGGMETSLFAAAAVGAVALALRGRLPSAAAAAGLAAVTRPEGLVTVLPVAILWWRAGRPRPAVCAGALLAPGLVWTIIAAAYFGSPVPHSLVAKAAPLYELPVAYAFLSVVAWTGRWTVPLGFADPAPLRDGLAFLLAQAAAVALVAEPTARRANGWAPALALNALIFFYAVTNPQMFDWYAAAVFPFWLIVLAAGLPALARLLSPGRARSPARFGARFDARFGARLGAGAAWAVVGIATALALGGWAAGRLDPAHEALRLRTLGYRDAALRLNALAPASATVAAAEIGALGWFWHGRILDGCGLVSPQAIPFLPVPAAARPDFRTSPIPAGLVEGERPEFVVSMPLFVATTLQRSREFMRDYRLIAEVPLPKRVWGADAVLVYRRSAVTPPAAETSHR